MQLECNRLTHLFPKTKTMYDLADQMDRSARSGKQNIVEGWRRNTTREYYDFLGFSIGAIAELEEDCNDIWKGVYGDLMGIKGVMGEMGTMGTRGKMDGMGIKGLMGERGTRGEMGNSLESSNNPSPLNPFNPFPPFDIEKLKFYPLDTKLPPIVQLKLRCKELNFLLHQIQNSLLDKMEHEKTLPSKDKIRMHANQLRDGEDAERKMLEQYGLEKLENGQVVKKKDVI